MNEPKRRGRPTNAEREARAQLSQAIADADCLNGEKAKQLAVSMGYESAHIKTSLQDIAQAYANRVWSGQSTDVPLKERIARVHAALNGQGLSTDVQLPPNG